MSRRVLVTNDDGIDAPGIRSLTRALADAGYEVRVVAPAADHSGMSASLGSLARREPIYFEERDLEEAPGVSAVAVATSPAGCALLALRGAFGDWRPDLVASGINSGANTGSAIQFSGTIGAAFAGARMGYPSLAVSLGETDQPFSMDDPAARFDAAAHLAVEVLTSVAEEPVVPGARNQLVYNLNVPGGPRDGWRGLVDASPATMGHMKTGFEIVDGALLTSYIPSEAPDEPGTDRDMLLAGWATLTVLGLPEVGDAGSVIARSGKPD